MKITETAVVESISANYKPSPSSTIWEMAVGDREVSSIQVSAQAPRMGYVSFYLDPENADKAPAIGATVTVTVELD